MSFFPAGFNPRDPSVALLDLVSIDTPDGVFRFLLGGDGRFTDRDGYVWIGSQLIESTDLGVSIGGEATEGSITMAFIPDPADGDLIADIRALGTDYIAGREITFWIQPLLSIEEFAAPTLPPVRFLTRTATSIAFDLTGALERRISLLFEGPFTGRNTASRLTYSTTDHSALIGSANSSLRHMPTDTYQEEKLFG